MTIFLIGDSTLADKPLDDNPERGWGQLFRGFLKSDILLENHAVNGRSSKSFIHQGLWANVLSKLNNGDYVFIQFGHNDSKISDTSRYAEAHTSFKKNLIKFVNESRSKGAVPVLITPVNRRKFDKEGNFVDQHADYPNVVREVSKEFNVPLIDLHAKSLNLFRKMGPEETKKLFLHIPPSTYKACPKGKEDNSHFSREGAIKIAELVIEGIKELKLPISKMLKDRPVNSTVGKGKVVSLDYYFNHEIKTDTDGKSLQFHYTWEDKDNSGFYILGDIIENLGATLSEIQSAPSKDILKNSSIYIIVDPDTPQENPSPNYITDSSAIAISEWVNNGGILLLMGNDKGNCEFEHLNALSERFGIHFNEISRNKVLGTNFNMGKFDHLPAHPIFAGVKKIYMKEISTFTLKPPATPVLEDGGDIIIAFSPLGKGAIIAVGDPWLYNEYIDNRKLPEEYENYKAALNLFTWLLEKSSIKKQALIP
ncbi:MAG: GDSL-type esterase/lipase family protein [Bacteroidota bacterium]|nr:GDSL-type esterase/lipase family protein [Bacteroidota bacterium]